MSKELEQFGTLLGEQAKGNVQIALKWATVTAVDWDNKTCDVVDLTDDLEFYDVLLGLGTVYKRPLVNTKCLIGIVENSAQAFLIECQSFDLIQFGDGGFNGLVKVDELRTQVDKNTKAIKTIQDNFKAFAPVPSDGGAALKVLMNTVFTNLPLADLGNIENENITHGK